MAIINNITKLVLASVFFSISHLHKKLSMLCSKPSSLETFNINKKVKILLTCMESETKILYTIYLSFLFYSHFRFTIPTASALVKAQNKFSMQTFTRCLIFYQME